MVKKDEDVEVTQKLAATGSHPHPWAGGTKGKDVPREAGNPVDLLAAARASGEKQSFLVFVNFQFTLSLVQALISTEPLV